MILIILLCISSLISIFPLIYMYKSKYVINDRFGYISISTASMAISFTLSLNIFLIFPDHFGPIGVLNLLLGIVIGFIFGRLGTTQSFVTGYYNGGISAVSGTMVGAIANDPSICGLPYSYEIAQYTIIMFGVLSTVLLIITVMLLFFSFRV